ncbi:putative er lumen protein retaining receptor [Basidiobolus meristosporus CBS 931.73]|uniref:ER lumen protein-retaining receptor n=1 Tax=Basidiobolus meristosporus CBS 931.73 TaxID=1314790 RepID=A0A1Y1XBU6_9FUNG|nr:putative er lumen protein retaining receptor [Basidiobolus meristosporus CBS 931.73]|eukprot:ORX83195.1 putative er lumen protein retaining receptor [Basidiobolus meristosporus CBS 931.73]
MNIFRITGDLLHLASILILLLKMHTTKSVAGISFKTQLLYAIVFTTRYLDLFTHFTYSAYNTLMKIFFLGSSFYILYLIRKKYPTTYSAEKDKLRLEYFIGPSALFALLFAAKYTTMEIMWTFSLALEAVAILPQLYMLSTTGEAETITTHYLGALGGYRAMYLLNWIYRYLFENHFVFIPVFTGVIQTILYLDFFYIYITKVLRGKKFKLPV